MAKVGITKPPPSPKRRTSSLAPVGWAIAPVSAVGDDSRRAGRRGRRAGRGGGSGGRRRRRAAARGEDEGGRKARDSQAAIDRVNHASPDDERGPWVPDAPTPDTRWRAGGRVRRGLADLGGRTTEFVVTLPTSAARPLSSLSSMSRGTALPRSPTRRSESKASDRSSGCRKPSLMTRRRSTSEGISRGEGSPGLATSKPATRWFGSAVERSIGEGIRRRGRRGGGGRREGGGLGSVCAVSPRHPSRAFARA